MLPKLFTYLPNYLTFYTYKNYFLNGLVGSEIHVLARGAWFESLLERECDSEVTNHGNDRYICKKEEEEEAIGK